ncbi:MAG: phage terminase small subunit P27 family [Brevundimonas sp.]|uniref:phage terminase small subunit P27 family n=1 Tax=Brevundimonas sp. TaxID=1871086 RepID=UPI002733BFD8|nr:phage terminase small subunit P27 family [Brevundimonas sp.]MDP3379761.1 phage terminase small subunit P27 family [Brevundimonas sp.]
MRGDKPALKTATNPVSPDLAAPAWMPAEARAEWRRVIRPLAERRILTEPDLGGLENYCLAIAQVRDCQKILGGLQSPFFEGDNGVPRPLAAIRVMHAAMTLARQMAAELGLTPVSRSRPAISDEGEDNGGFGDLVD